MWVFKVLMLLLNKDAALKKKFSLYSALFFARLSG